MNPEQLLTAVEECIRERPRNDAKLWTICWHENKLKCLPSRAVKNDGNCFGTFGVDDLKKGLTLDQWASVAKKITLFFELLPPKGEVLYIKTPERKANVTTTRNPDG